MAMCSRAWILGEEHFHKVYLDCHIQGQGLLTDMISLAGLKGTHYPQTVWSNFCSFQTALFIWCLAWITMIVSKRRSSLSKKKKKKTKCELLKLIDGDRLAEPWLLKLMTSLRKGDFEWSMLATSGSYWRWQTALRHFLFLSITVTRPALSHEQVKYQPNLLFHTSYKSDIHWISLCQQYSDTMS